MELTPLHWLLIAVVVLLLLNFLIRARSPGRAGETTYRSDVPPPPPDPEVLAMLKRGHKIVAIKRYRAQSGMGLKEAKDYLESLARDDRDA